ncbi:hypothetical protein MKZ07_28030 [Paenibacillus sp. FSL P4-0338]
MSVRKPAVGEGSHGSRGESPLQRNPRCGGITVAGKSTVAEVSASA